MPIRAIISNCCLERVDMLFLIVEDLGEQVAADIVADLLAMRDRVLELATASMLELEVGLEDFLDILADAQPAEHLEIGQAVEEQDALGEVGRRASSRRSIRARSNSASFWTPQLSSIR